MQLLLFPRAQISAVSAPTSQVISHTSVHAARVCPRSLAGQLPPAPPACPLPTPGPWPTPFMNWRRPMHPSSKTGARRSSMLVVDRAGGRPEQAQWGGRPGEEGRGGGGHGAHGALRSLAY
eukprot:COSAG01_NODE_7160_length_3324_cov_192.600620_2_plen_121_part_00